MLAHGSGMNHSAAHRVGLVLRIIPTNLEVKFDSPVRLISGEDTYGYHELV